MRRSNSISCGLILFTLLALLLTACSSGPQVMDGEDMVRSYTQISQDEAKKMMEQDGTQIIVDVRMQEEYDSGHIPGAICIPNESIGTEPLEELPDFDQIILIYCRSGNRSKQAAQQDDFYHLMNGKFCGEAWDAISRYVYTALQGGSIMKGWTNDDRMMIACCNDGTRPVIFKIERIDIPENDEEREWLAKQNFRNTAEDAYTG